MMLTWTGLDCVGFTVDWPMVRGKIEERKHEVSRACEVSTPVNRELSYGKVFKTHWLTWTAGASSSVPILWSRKGRRLFYLLKHHAACYEFMKGKATELKWEYALLDPSVTTWDGRIASYFTDSLFNTHGSILFLKDKQNSIKKIWGYYPHMAIALLAL